VAFNNHYKSYLGLRNQIQRNRPADKFISMPHLQSRRWHTKVVGDMWSKSQKISSKYNACIISPCDGFNVPDIWILQSYTNEYLENKGTLSEIEVDMRLGKLIVSSKYYAHAILACAHRLSRGAVRSYLVELLAYVSSWDHYKNYIAMVILVSQLNQKSMSPDEMAKAKAILTSMYIENESHAKASMIPDLLQRGVDETLFKDKGDLLSIIMTKTFTTTASRLAPFRYSFDRWIDALSLVSWLQELTTMSEVSINFSTMDDTFPDWRAWANWRPNKTRIEWISRYSNYLIGCKDLVSLEGPSFIIPQHINLASALLEEGPDVINGNFSMSRSSYTGSPEEMIENIFRVLQKACEHSKEAVNLVASTIMKDNVQLEPALRAVDAILDNAAITAPYFFRFEKVLGTQARSLTTSDLLGVIAILDVPQLKAVQIELGSLINTTMDQRIRQVLTTVSSSYEEGYEIPDSSVQDLVAIQSAVASFTWLQRSLDTRVAKMIGRISSIQTVQVLCGIKSQLGSNLQNYSLAFSIFDEYAAIVLSQKVTSIDSQKFLLVNDFVELWQKSTFPETKSLLLGAINYRFSVPLICIKLIKSISTELSDKDCSDIWNLIEHGTDENCVKFASLLCKLSPRKLSSDSRQAWAQILYSLLFRHRLSIDSWAAAHLTLIEWIEFHSNVYSFITETQTSKCPETIFSDERKSWIQALQSTPSVELKSIDRLMEPGASLKSLLLCAEPVRPHLLVAFQTLASHGQQEWKSLYSFFISRLPLQESTGIVTLKILIDGLPGATDEEIQTFLYLAQLSGSTSRLELAGLARTYFHKIGMLPVPAIPVTFKDHIVSVFTNPHGQTTNVISAASTYLDKKYKEIVDRLGRIEALKRALKINNHTKTAEFLATLGIDDEESLLFIPDSLVDVVEEVSYTEYEIVFPLDHIKPLQRLALGVGEAKNAILRLKFANGASQPGFCVHLDPDQSPNEFLAHQYWNEELAPEMPHCARGKQNLLTFQVYRQVRRCVMQGPINLEDMYKQVSDCLQNILLSCYLCGTKHALQIRSYRPLVCNKTACNSLVLPTSIEEALLRFDFRSEVYDLFLLAFANVANTSKLLYLPGLPYYGDAPTLKRTINAIPATSSLSVAHIQGASKQTTSFTALPPVAASLMRFISSFPTFITTAAGPLRIPSLPNVHQFIVASSSIEIESARAKHLRGNNSGIAVPTKVAFHGTTLDRLFAILSEGLRVGSGTSLQRTGASYGKGIYCSSEPGTAFAYAAMGTSWSGSRFGTCGVVLGLEVVGTHRNPSQKITVVEDPEMVSVRYIFLVPSGMKAPLANHIVPAMTSAYALLRAGLA
jgi:hypothetical protein